MSRHHTQATRNHGSKTFRYDTYQLLLSPKILNPFCNRQNFCNTERYYLPEIILVYGGKSKKLEIDWENKIKFPWNNTLDKFAKMHT